MTRCCASLIMLTLCWTQCQLLYLLLLEHGRRARTPASGTCAMPRIGCRRSPSKSPNLAPHAAGEIRIVSNVEEAPQPAQLGSELAQRLAALLDGQA